MEINVKMSESNTIANSFRCFPQLKQPIHRIFCVQPQTAVASQSAHSMSDVLRVNIYSLDQVLAGGLFTTCYNVLTRPKNDEQLFAVSVADLYRVPTHIGSLTNLKI